MNEKILICVPCHNRRRIVELCVPTICAGMSELDRLNIYDDGGTFDVDFLHDLGAKRVHRSVPAIGIEAQRRMHFFDFAHCELDYTHLYLTDSDALHDPRWRERALALQDETGGAPVCLYNTDAHVRIEGNTVEDHPGRDYIWRRVAPGISYLLNMEHVRVIVRALPHLPDYWNWDWTVPNLLGSMMAISRISYVDHIGHGGMHHPADEGLDGGDVALSPTSWLVTKRAEVVKKLASFDCEN
jgi:hypothetical protein